MSYLESLDNDALLLLANKITKEYNTTRHTFVNKAKYYDRQAISNYYHKEEDMIDLLEQLKTLRGRYKAVADILVRREHKPVMDGWQHSNNDLFAGQDILHSA